MKAKLSVLTLLINLSIGLGKAQTKENLHYHIDAGITTGKGQFAPLWLTANKQGLSSVKPNSTYLKTGVQYQKKLRQHWTMATELDVAVTKNQVSDFVIQQAYIDFGWKFINLSIGSKERDAELKNARLSSGGMVEGNNARPIPQMRFEIPDYTTIPGTQEWLAVKGHVAYGRFTDDRWQRHFAGPNQKFAEDILYHSKAIMFRIGNKKKYPLELDFGIQIAAQFGGDQYEYDDHRNAMLKVDMPTNIKEFWKVLIPSSGDEDTPEGEQVNIYGNHVGSWNLALTGYIGEWKLKGYYEHFFDDHSQMFFEYGRWKDGHIGIEITFPRNNWIKTLLWEGLATKDQTGPILYDGFWGEFPEYQISANDNYYNHYLYQSWQHWGMGIGNPLLPGPIYNKDGSLVFRSNRALAHHIGIEGDWSEAWNYRILLSYTRHWGTYSNPLDEVKKQFNSLWEITWKPEQLPGCCISISAGIDRGNYLGNNTGAMLRIRKTGFIKFN